MSSTLIALRRDLHAHPEVAHQEQATARRVVEFLAPLAPDRVLTGVGGTGVVATFDSGSPGPTILFRSELDALPIVERLTVDHTSEPENGENPSLAVADLLHRCAALAVADPAEDAFGLITPVHVRIGSIAYGVSAGDAEVHLTLRSHTDAGLASLQREVLAAADELAARDGLVLTSETVEDFHATVNEPVATATVTRAAQAAGLAVSGQAFTLRAGEDFGLFSRRFPCCMVLLGAGELHEPLHGPDYDFPDALIGTGVRLFEAVVAEVLR